MDSAKNYQAMHHTHWRLLRTVLIVFLGTGMLSACSGCGGKKKSGNRNAVVPPPAVDPTPTPQPPATPPAPAPSPGTDDQGEEVPPITVDSASNIDTKTKAALKHLIFETSSAQEAGRYLSEYMIAIYSRETSCVRLKVRPTAGVSNEVDESVLQNGNEGTGACEGQKISGEETEAPVTDPGTEKEVPEDTAALRKALAESELDYITPDAIAKRGFNLAGQTAALCSSRIFRMRASAEKDDPLSKIFTKTGRLLHIGGKVRIWLDEEYANPCTGGPSLDSRSPVGYGLLVQERVAWLNSYVGKLWTAHLQALGKEMDKILTDMTATYGPVSDIDSSGYVEVFMSPDVNRAQFTRFLSRWPDHFTARHEFKPEDLAFYNSATNPASNEGEVLYMFAPDQGGLYNQLQFPSPDSVATNFAKGFLSAQAMNLIVANQKLFAQKQKKMEDQWLSDSLSTLASMYYGGNDYMFNYLAHYLTSRPQYLGIDIGADKSLLTESYMSMAGAEAFGMRGMFGWYLHTRLCGPATVAPCAKLKGLIDSKEYGVKNVETLLGEPFDKIMINFTLSVGIGMVRDPAKALAFWDKGTPGLPSKPLLMPSLTEIYKTAVPVTEETDSTGALLTTAKEDRTQASPFPSRDSLLFQTITSDNDMEFKTAANSVAYILVTSLVESKTDVTAFFGKGLNVTFIPIGDRDPERRRIHVEKVSELAHRDLRPVNLTQSVDPDQTNRFDKTYENLDFSVTPDRELWVMGSIDNYLENVEGVLTTIGDTDAYTIEVQPCAGKTGTDLTTCEAEAHDTLIQVHIRDFDKELAPMAIVTIPDTVIYRGSSILGRMTDIDPDWSVPGGITADFSCQSERFWNPAGSPNTCDNGGLGTMQPDFSHLQTMVDQTAYGHNYFNFLMLAPKGFPFPNINSVSYIDMPECPGGQCYLQYETVRQHYNFKFDKSRKPYVYRYFPISGQLNVPEGATLFDGLEKGILASLKRKVSNPPCTAPSAEFVAECSTVAELTTTDCENICSDYLTIENKVKAYVVNENKFMACFDGICLDEITLTTAAPPTTAWIGMDRFVQYSLSYTSRVTYAPPAEPYDSSYCRGEAGGTPKLTCNIVGKYNEAIDDIRQQFNVLSSELAIEGCYGTIGVDFKVCFDDQSWEREVAPEEPYKYRIARERLATDRLRQYYYPITSRAGEVISKPERMQLLWFKTPGTGAVMNVIVGGRKQSQGKYLIRTRMKNFEAWYHP